MAQTIGVGTFRTTPKIRAMVNEVLDNERLSYGPMCKAFEQEFAKIHNAPYAVLSNSGTSSLHVALQAMKEYYGWQDGDEVIVPAVTFVATINVILHNNLKPVLVDVDSDFYEIDINLIERAITDKTAAIIPVHLFGQPCNMKRIAHLAWDYGLCLLEDSCETMFVKDNGHWIGKHSDITCFSTYVAHLLTTGVGGIATTSNPDLAVIMRSLVNHGRDNIYISIDDNKGLTDGALQEMIGRRFRFERVGHSFRITELEAAIGLGQLIGWEDMITARQWNAEYLTKHLSVYEDRVQLPLVRPGTEHAFMMYPLVMRNEPKQDICLYLEERGIETREMLPLTNQPVYASWCNEDDYPVAKWINQNGFYIGCHQDLRRADLDYIIDTFKGYFDGQ